MQSSMTIYLIVYVASGTRISKAIASNLYPLNPWPTYALSPTIPDQNMTNLRCTADHHVIPPLNLRPVESWVIQTIFQPRSPRPLRAGPTNPRCISDQNTLSPIKTRSLPIRQFFKSGKQRGLVGSLVWRGALRVFSYIYHKLSPFQNFLGYLFRRRKEFH